MNLFLYVPVDEAALSVRSRVAGHERADGSGLRAVARGPRGQVSRVRRAPRAGSTEAHRDFGARRAEGPAGGAGAGR